MTRLNRRQLQMLRMLSMAPRELHGFTGMNGLALSPRIAETYLAHLTDEGYADVSERGVYSITPLGLAHLESNSEPVQGRQWGAWSTTDPYVPPAWKSTRDGADDHRAYRSLGGC